MRIGTNPHRPEEKAHDDKRCSPSSVSTYLRNSQVQRVIPAITVHLPTGRESNWSNKVVVQFSCTYLRNSQVQRVIPAVTVHLLSQQPVGLHHD